jgi:diacylglycerol O-acyltransferase
MSDQLTALDATFLELEESDETAHMHVGSLVTFEPPADGRLPTLDELAEHLEERLTALPRYRQRLSERHTGGLHWPRWEDDPHFDIRNHLSRVALPAPGGEHELLEWVAEFWSQRLDRARPLWGLVLVEGLDGGHWAIATKTHHCMVDGVGSVDVALVMFDSDPHPPRTTWSPPVVPIPAERPGLLRSWLGVLAQLADPRNLPAIVQRTRRALSVVVRDEVVAAPHTSLNDPIGTHRRIAAVTADIEELKWIKRELGGTVNDVVLAAVTGGLRRLLAERGETPPDEGLRAMVPVNVRGATEHMALGNRVSSLFVRLPVSEPDPVARYLATRFETNKLKQTGEAEGSSAIVEFGALMPPALHAAVARSLFATRLFNVTVTNIPGPPETLYAFGCAMDQVFGLVPLAAAHAVGVAVVSYAGEVTFTIAADHDTVPDIDVFAAGVRESLAELRQAIAVT